MEGEFGEAVLQPRARLFCMSVVSNIKLELDVKGLAQTRCGFLVLLLNELIRQQVDWINELIRLKSLREEPVTLGEMYRYVAVLLLSYTTGFSFEMTLEILKASGCVTPSLSRVRFISSNTLGYSPTGRGEDSSLTWDAQRDRTRGLSQFEALAFRASQEVFFCPLHLLATLDDELYGTRASDNQVKTLSARKADREGHSADVLADALFRIVLAIRFRRRGETQVESVRKMFTVLLDGRGEESLSGCIMTADRGYGKEAFMQLMMQFRFCSVFVMPDHILQCHPFVAKSFLNPLRGDMEAVEPAVSGGDRIDRAGGMEEGAGIAPNTAGGASIAAAPSTGAVVDDDGLEVTDQVVGNDQDVRRDFIAGYDRRADFVIDDDPDLGPEAVFATKSFPSVGRRRGNPPVTAVAVREHGTNKFARVLRFMYTVPPHPQSSINTWIAVPKPEVSMDKILFSGYGHADATLQSMRVTIETRIGEKCDVLTLGQRCADWFVLRQFRVTGTNAGQMLMSCPEVRDVLKLQDDGESGAKADAEWFEVLQRGWFSNKVSTEPMMRGTVNEPAVINALKRMQVVKGIFDVGMVAAKHARYLACSPDSVALLDVSSFGEWAGSAARIPEGSDVVMASVEIKTRVAQSTLGRAVQLSSANLLRCDVGDSTFRRYVPREHMGQLLHQAIVLQVEFVLYVVAAESGVLYMILIKFRMADVLRCESALIGITETLLRSIYQESSSPEFVSEEQKMVLDSRLAFWRVVDEHVRNNGCFVPLKLFKHASQSFYSKTKGGVDGSTQQRAVLRSSTSHLKWEQKIVTQTFKAIAINSFIAWRMFQREDLLQSDEAFKSLDKYRNSLNKVEATADFMMQVSRELLSYSATLEREDVEDELSIQSLDHKADETKRLVALAHASKRNRVKFFNSTDGVALRLFVRGHDHEQGVLTYCTLCGQHTEGYRGRRSTFRCLLCHVFLCKRILPGFRRSCWGLWHSQKKLELRRTPALTVSRGSTGAANNQSTEEVADVRHDGVTGVSSGSARSTRSRSRSDSSVERASQRRRFS